MLEIYLFGQFRLRFNGVPVQFSRRPKAVPLLAYLLLRQTAPQARDTLAFTIWPEDTEENARANLRRHLGYLRDSLATGDHPWFVVDGETVQWNTEARAWVDALEFDRRIAEREGRPAAVKLYGGELLSDYYDDWIIAERERLRGAYIGGLWDLSVEARGRRDIATAAEYLQWVLADDPWREDALRSLMAVRYEGGDRAGALSLCARFEQRLRDEMNVPLMPETAALRAAIERDEPLPTVPPQRAAESVKVAPPDLPFGGRDAEMSRLQGAWERALEGRGSTVLISGEVGIGKTRLATEFAVRLESRGARVLWGSTSQPESGPHQPVSEALRAAGGFLDSLRMDAYERAVLRRIVPTLLPGDAAEPSDEGSLEASALFKVVGDTFARLATQRPLIVVLDDLHRAGPATLALVQHLERRARTARMLVVAIAREAEPGAPQTLRALRRPYDAEPAVNVSLGPIDLADIAGIAARADVAHLGEKLRDDIAALSHGHPLFLRELIEHAAENRGLGAELPRGVHDVIEERLTRLSPNARLLLSAASVVGASFDLDVVSDIVGWSEAQLVEAADELVERRTIRESATSGSFDFQFSHDLIAAAAYERIEERQRQRWHRRTARVAERQYATRLDEMAPFIARHFERAGAGGSAAQYYLRAARNAAKLFANDEALAYVERGLALAPAAAVHFDLVAAASEVHDRIADRNAQRRDQDELDRLARELTDDERGREALRRRALLELTVGSYDAARRAAADLLREAGSDSRWQAVALRANATIDAHIGNYEAAEAAIGRSIERYENADDEAGVLFALTLRAYVLAQLARRDAALADIERAKALRAVAQRPDLLVRVLYCEMQVLHGTSSQRDVAEALLWEASRIGDRLSMAATHEQLGLLDKDAGAMRDARQHLETALELYGETDPQGTMSAYNNLAGIEMLAGRLDRATALANDLAQLASRIGSLRGETYAALLRCEIALLNDAYEDALGAASALRDVATRWGEPLFTAQALQCRGVALRETGCAQDAVAPLREATERLGAIQAHRYATVATAELALSEALSGKAVDARNHADAARAAANLEPLSRDAGFLSTLARTYAALGDGGAACEIFATARRTLASLRSHVEAQDLPAFDALPLHRAIASG